MVPKHCFMVLLNNCHVTWSLSRKNNTTGGIILTASHNPGGPDADFGIKFNMANGGPAPDQFTDKIYALSQSLDSYLICPTLSCDFAQLGTSQYTVEGGQQGGFTVEVVDPCTDYVDLMKSIFNFDEEPVYYPDIKFPVLYLLIYY